ncbi:MAG: NADH-quinone oxidoreductase subunit NuoH [Bacteroidetes bacterium]|nr:NADH-quinone oxidoreductase subunit NuoH [Bacteroidota bacterium]
MSTLIIIKIIIILVIFAITLFIAMYSTYAERKIAAVMQDRIGPNRAGPWGILQPLADGGKMFFKEDFIPAFANKKLFIIAPGIAMFTALMTSAIIPWGGSITIWGQTFDLQVADVDIGILYILGVVSIGVYGIMIGGWASNNKYSLFGAVRSSSQMISYELAMGLSILAVIMTTGSLSLKDIVEAQDGGKWNVFYQPLACLLFIVCAFAECNRAPFDLAECESELIGGYHTEYGSMKLGFFLFAEYINMFISSAIISTLFFGGYNFPFMHDLGLSSNALTIVGTLVFFAKICFFIFFFMWVRWTLPRFRYDQLMHLGWKTLIPLAVFNLMLTGGIMLLRDLF